MNLLLHLGIAAMRRIAGRLMLRSPVLRSLAAKHPRKTRPLREKLVPFQEKRKHTSRFIPLIARLTDPHDGVNCAAKLAKLDKLANLKRKALP